MEANELRSKNVDDLSRNLIMKLDDAMDEINDRACFLRNKDFDLDIFIKELKSLRGRVINEVLQMKARVQEKVILDNRALFTPKQEGNVIYHNFPTKVE